MRFVFDSWFIHSVQCHLGHKITSCFCDDSEITWRCLLAVVSLWVWLTCCLWNNFATFLMSEEIAQCQTPSTKDLFHWDKYDRILTYGYIWSRFLHHWLCHYGKFPPPCNTHWSFSCVFITSILQPTPESRQVLFSLLGQKELTTTIFGTTCLSTQQIFHANFTSNVIGWSRDSTGGT